MGRLDQISNRCDTSSKPGEFVDIIVQELVLDELGSDALQNLVNYRPCEEQRRRVSSGEKGHIDGNDGSKPLEYFDPQRARFALATYYIHGMCRKTILEIWD